MNKVVHVNDRRLIDGPQDRMMCISPLRHPWARDIWRVMLNNTWFPQEIDFSKDVKQYRTLSDAEKTMYNRALAFLSNLDGIQFNNLTLNIGNYITSPEVSMCISRQSWEEANHVDAYATMIEAITDDPQDIYGLFARDDTLSRKNKYIMRQSEILGEDYSARNFALAVVANICLEGIYFFSGFLAFYTLARNGKMLNSADNIRFIQRDENIHKELFIAMWETLQAERPEIFDEGFYTDVVELIKSAVDLEASWGKYIIEGGVLGLSDAIVEDYIKHLADGIAGRLGLPKIYGVKNPVPWVEDFSNINGEESNFFESKVKAYAIGGSLEW